MDDSDCALFRRYRKTSGLTQVEAAARLGVEQATISRYEKWRRPPSSHLAKVRKLALAALKSRRKVRNAKAKRK